MNTSEQRYSEAKLQAYVDGKLTEIEMLEITEYLTQHPQIANRIANYKKQNDMLGALYAEGDAELTARCKETFTQSVTTTKRRYLPYVASIAWLIVGIVVGSSFKNVITQPQLQATAFNLPITAMNAHAVYTPEVRHPVEVAASQEKHLVKWLSKRLDRKLKIPDLNAEGFALVGGRLLPADAEPAAQFMYENANGDRLTLYVTTKGGDDADTSFRFVEEKKMKVFYWTDAQMGFAITSNIAKANLLRTANRVYKQLAI